MTSLQLTSDDHRPKRPELVVVDSEDLWPQQNNKGWSIKAGSLTSLPSLKDCLQPCGYSAVKRLAELQTNGKTFIPKSGLLLFNSPAFMYFLILLSFSIKFRGDFYGLLFFKKRNPFITARKYCLLVCYYCSK